MQNTLLGSSMLQPNVVAISIAGPQGRIWTSKPSTSVNGLVTVLQVPASKVSEAVRQPEYTVVALDALADRMLTVDTRGTTYLYNIRHNRYVCLDKVGHAGTAACFSQQCPRMLFVAYADASIRCYDCSKNTCVGLLKEHRSPVRHLDAHTSADELLSTSVDGVIIWDTKKLIRKRVLGSGPYGAIKATYTADGQGVITHFKDGSFYMWSSANFKLLKAFTLPVAPELRALQSTFARSPDGQLLVSGGSSVPLLYVYSAISGTLLYAIVLPTPAELSGLQGQPRAGPLAGVQQLIFLPDSQTVAVLIGDGSILFVDLRSCRQTSALPYFAYNRRDSRMSIDKRAAHLALMANGKVHLYDLSVLSSTPIAVELQRVDPQQLPDVAQALNQVRLEQARREQQHDQAVSADLPAADAADGHRDQGPAATSQADVPQQPVGAQPRGNARVAPSASRSKGRPPPGAAAGARKPPTAPPKGRAADAFGPVLSSDAGLDPQAVALNRSRLTSLLEAFGEYPAKYRLLVWDFLLRLPHNKAAFANLVALGPHPSYDKLSERSPALASLNRALAQRLEATLSQLAHWCPVFAEASFLPGLVFPFVKMYAIAAGPGAALDEACFELLATLLVNWCRTWFERFPHPPLGILNRLQDLLQFHDAPLAAHFASSYRGGLPSVVWPHLATLLTDLLPRHQWIRLWDHCFTVGPDFLHYFVIAYLIHLRTQLLALDTDHKLANWLAALPAIDMDKVLQVAYALRKRTPEEVRPAPPDWEPLPQGLTYTEFKDYNAGAVELFARDRAKIRDAEDAIMRRRAVVSELELRSRAVALQAASLSTERQQLAALEEERRAVMRQVEAEAAEQLQRLDDRAKEERLRQVAVVEQAYQASLLEVRATWQRELESVRAEVAHKRALMAQQLRSKEEEEQIKALEFHARQRMMALEQDTMQAALASKVRDELTVRQAEVEAKQRAALQQWDQEEEARRIKAEHEVARAAKLAAQAQQEAAKQAAAREALALQLQSEDNMLRLDNERRLRHMAEDQQAITNAALAAEQARLTSRAEAQDLAVRMQAKADVAWYEAEQMRREQMLQQEKLALEAATAEARKRLTDAEDSTRAMAAQATLMDRRRFLERQNANEEVELRRLMEAILAERARDAQLAAELEAKEQEMKSKLDYAARVGSLQREVEGKETLAAEGLRAQLQAQQAAELRELRMRHEAIMERLASERQAQMSEVASDWQTRVQAQQLQELRAQQRAFERRKEMMADELLQQERRARGDPGADGGRAAGGGMGGPRAGHGASRRASAEASWASRHRPPLDEDTPARSDLVSESNMTPASSMTSVPPSVGPSPVMPKGYTFDVLVVEGAGRNAQPAPHARVASAGSLSASVHASATAAAAVARAAQTAVQAVSPTRLPAPVTAPPTTGATSSTGLSPLWGQMAETPTVSDYSSAGVRPVPGGVGLGHTGSSSGASLGQRLAAAAASSSSGTGPASGTGTGSGSGSGGTPASSSVAAAVALVSSHWAQQQQLPSPAVSGAGSTLTSLPEGRSSLQESGLLGLSQPAAVRAMAMHAASSTSTAGASTSSAGGSSASFRSFTPAARSGAVSTTRAPQGEPAPATSLPSSADTATGVAAPSPDSGSLMSLLASSSPSEAGLLSLPTRVPAAATSALTGPAAAAPAPRAPSPAAAMLPYGSSATSSAGGAPPQGRGAQVLGAPGGRNALEEGVRGPAATVPVQQASPGSSAASMLASASGDVAALLQRLQLNLDLTDEDMAALALDHSVASTESGAAGPSQPARERNPADATATSAVAQGGGTTGSATPSGPGGGQGQQWHSGGAGAGDFGFPSMTWSDSPGGTSTSAGPTPGGASTFSAALRNLGLTNTMLSGSTLTADGRGPYRDDAGDDDDDDGLAALLGAGTEELLGGLHDLSHGVADSLQASTVGFGVSEPTTPGMVATTTAATTPADAGGRDDADSLLPTPGGDYGVLDDDDVVEEGHVDMVGP